MTHYKRYEALTYKNLMVLFFVYIMLRNVIHFTLLGDTATSIRPQMNKFRTKTEQNMNKN